MTIGRSSIFIVIYNSFYFLICGAESMDMILLAPILGIIVGIVAAFFGIGGGVLFVPILILVFCLPIKTAIGTSLLAVFITSISSMIAYWRQKRIIYKAGLIFGVATIPGAILGAYLTTIIHENLLRIFFSLFLLFVAFNIVRKGRRYEDDPMSFSYEPHRKDIVKILFFAFMSGLLSAFLGIGGGVLNVPIMVLVLHIPIHFAIATSCFIIVVTSFTGLTQHFMYGQVLPIYGILLGIGSIIGAQIGARISKRTKSKTLRKLFALLMVIVAIRLTLSAYQTF